MEMNKWVLGGKLVYKWTPKKERDKQGGSATTILSPMRAILTGSSSYSSVVAPLSRPGPQKRLQLKFPGDGGGSENATKKKREKHQQGGSTTTIHSPMRAIFAGSSSYSSVTMPPFPFGDDEEDEELDENNEPAHDSLPSAATGGAKKRPRRGNSEGGGKRKRARVEGNFVAINLKKRSYAPTGAGQHRNKKWMKRGRRRGGA